MFNFNMAFKWVPLACFVLTMLTRIILYFIMNRFYVFLEMGDAICRIFALATCILRIRIGWFSHLDVWLHFTIWYWTDSDVGKFCWWQLITLFCSLFIYWNTWVDLVFGVPQRCVTAMPILPVFQLSNVKAELTELGKQNQNFSNCLSMHDVPVVKLPQNILTTTFR